MNKKIDNIDDVDNKEYKKRGGFLFKIIKPLFILFFTITLFGALAFLYLYATYGQDLPSLEKFSNYSPNLITKIYDSNDELIAEYYTERRILAGIDEIPDMIINTTVAVEDTDFYNHKGINFQGILRAMLTNLKEGKIVEGGSSITQQIAKLLFLNPERTIGRKFREMLISYEIEQKFSKQEILNIYLNHIYYGHGAYGIKAAGMTYFGKDLDQLDISEIAMLVGLPKGPANYSPYRHPKEAFSRRNHVINRMATENLITKEDAARYKAADLNLVPLGKPLNKAPWFTEYVRRELEQIVGSDALYNGGLEVKTTLNLKLQKAANDAVKAGLKESDSRLGYRGRIGDIKFSLTDKNIDYNQLFASWLEQFSLKDDPMQAFSFSLLSSDDDDKRKVALVETVSEDLITVRFQEGSGYIKRGEDGWVNLFDPEVNARYAVKEKDARKVFKRGDVIEVTLLSDKADKDGYYSLSLDQFPDLQGALLALNVSNGAILAMIGGYDSNISEFNRATQALRQPGSAFKPVIYTTGLMNGFTPASIIFDSPIMYEGDENRFGGWKPMNFEQKFYGPTTIREALSKSRNVVTIKILEAVGIEKAIAVAKALGISTELDKNLGLALGVSPVKLIDLATVYATLANFGVRNNPFAIEYLKDSKGEFIYKHETKAEPVIDPSVSFLMVNMLKSVINEGTAEIVGREFDMPIIGKTGTTNDYNDAWFIGGTKEVITAVWVGRDDNKKIGRGETGSRAAIPIWLRFFRKCKDLLKGDDFKPTDDIVFARINKETGLLALPDDPDPIFEAFIDGTQPNEFSVEPEDKKLSPNDTNL